MMRISTLIIFTNDVPCLIRHYRDVIGLSLIDHDETSATFQIGWSRFIIRHIDTPFPSVYHFAFGIVPNSIISAKTWLENRTPLLRDAEGETQFNFSEWEAKAVYWKDPDGNILELISPDDETHPAHNAPFTPADIVGISEIGIATEDVIAYANHLTERYALPSYRTVNDVFSPMGSDVYGRLIVVKAARLWFPQLTTPALPLPLSVEMDGSATITF